MCEILIQILYLKFICYNIDLNDLNKKIVYLRYKTCNLKQTYITKNCVAKDL